MVLVFYAILVTWKCKKNNFFEQIIFCNYFRAKNRYAYIYVISSQGNGSKRI